MRALVTGGGRLDDGRGDGSRAGRLRELGNRGFLHDGGLARVAVVTEVYAALDACTPARRSR